MELKGFKEAMHEEQATPKLEDASGRTIIAGAEVTEKTRH